MNARLTTIITIYSIFTRNDSTVSCHVSCNCLPNGRKHFRTIFGTRGWWVTSGPSPKRSLPLMLQRDRKCLLYCKIYCSDSRHSKGTRRDWQDLLPSQLLNNLLRWAFLHLIFLHMKYTGSLPNSRKTLLLRLCVFSRLYYNVTIHYSSSLLSWSLLLNFTSEKIFYKIVQFFFFLIFFFVC